MGRGFTAHFRSTPFFTLLALMKIPLRAKKNAAMVRLALEPRLMAAFTCTVNVLLLLLLFVAVVTVNCYVATSLCMIMCNNADVNIFMCDYYQSLNVRQAVNLCW